MEFTCVIYVIFNDGTATKKSMYACDNADSAVASAHQYMGQYMAKPNVESCMAMAINSIGGVYANYHWQKPIGDVPAEEQ